MISVVIPVLNEQELIGPCLERLAEQPGAGELIVVDGGSDDRTVERARAGARVLSSKPGRGLQMNTGARAARGETLLFLHVDTVLGPEALVSVARALADQRVVGGGFLKSYQDAGRLLRLLAAVLNRVRAGRFKHLVGTQAIFVRRSVFEQLGGYKELALLEDVEFSDRLRRRGRVCVIDPPVTVSARRYLERGVLRQILINAVVLGLYRLGLSPRRLLRLYRGWAA